MENTVQNKSSFYGLYIGQEIWTTPQWNNKYPVEYYFGDCWKELNEPDETRFNIDGDHIELYNISSITDQDAIELAKIGLPERVYDYLWSSQTGKAIARSIQEGRQTNTYYPFFRMGDAFDFLRSKGYAIDWLCLSVDQQIKYGWVKLKDKE